MGEQGRAFHLLDHRDQGHSSNILRITPLFLQKPFTPKEVSSICLFLGSASAPTQAVLLARPVLSGVLPAPHNCSRARTAPAPLGPMDDSIGTIRDWLLDTGTFCHWDGIVRVGGSISGSTPASRPSQGQLCNGGVSLPVTVSGSRCVSCVHPTARFGHWYCSPTCPNVSHRLKGLWEVTLLSHLC